MKPGIAKIISILRNQPPIVFLVLLLLANFYWARSNFNDLRQRADSSQDQVEKLTRASRLLAEDQEKLRAEISKLGGRLSVEGRLDTQQENPLLRDIKFVKPGLYTAEVELSLDRVRRSGKVDAKYTIYHISAPVGTGKSQRVINLGLAVGDLTTGPQFYIDHDQDNKVDAELLYDFVALIPYAGLIGKTLSEDNSQTAYDGMREKIDSAEFTSLEDIEQKGSRIAKALWSLLGSQSERLLKWGEKSKSAQ